MHNQLLPRMLTPWLLYELKNTFLSQATITWHHIKFTYKRKAMFIRSPKQLTKWSWFKTTKKPFASTSVWVLWWKPRPAQVPLRAHSQVHKFLIEGNLWLGEIGQVGHHQQVLKEKENNECNGDRKACAESWMSVEQTEQGLKGGSQAGTVHEHYPPYWCL